MDEIGNVMAPSGKAALACPDDLLLIALPTVRLEFEPSVTRRGHRRWLRQPQTASPSSR